MSSKDCVSSANEVKLIGRSDDIIILRGVNVFPTQIEEVLLATDWCGAHLVIELTREGRMEERAFEFEGMRPIG